MATEHKPYQGYPYKNPVVCDAPSISADAAARWQHLPRRQIEVNVTREAPSSPSMPENLPTKRDSGQQQVVYIDMPESSGSIVADRRPIEEDFEMVPPQRSRRPVKQDPDAPVVYIDVPGHGEGSVTTSRENTPDEPTFVQETIFYDPFENRRIDREKESDDDNDDSTAEPARRPNFLDLNGAGPSGSSYTPPVPPMMSKESNIYSARSDDDFPASPIPVSQFPEPPPSYTEIDSTPVVDQPRPHRTPSPPTPPRTQVITTPQFQDMPMPLGVPNPDRKYLNCHHCGMRVHALVVLKTGCPTHLAAAFCLLFACIPFIILIYWKDFFKVRNHYCPNCNKVIGYQGPLSEKIIYVNSD